MPTDPTGRISHLSYDHRGITWKQAVRVASTGNLTLSGTQSIDGVACVAGDTVLAKDQTAGFENGIWIVASGVWTRAADMDQDTTTTAVPAEEFVGAMVYVVAGTTNGGHMFACTNTSSPVIGTTAITFVDKTGSGSGVTGFATPAIVLGTAAAAGSATTVIRSDSTIVA